MSRTARSARSLSSWTSFGPAVYSPRRCISAQRVLSAANSERSCATSMPCAAVRSMTPSAPPFVSERPMPRRRARSSSPSIFLDTPTYRIPASSTMLRPGSVMWQDSRAPFAPGSARMACTSSCWPGRTRFSMRALPSMPASFLSPWANRRMSLAARKPFFSMPKSTKAAFMPGSTFSTRPR